jgi:hypothetical protein
MPTGYTCIIEDDDATFFEYAWRCARSMGALIMQRDDRLSAPIRVEKESDYYKRNLKEAEERLEKLLSMPAEEKDVEAAAAHEKALSLHQDSFNKYTVRRDRYNQMRDHIDRWNIPEDSPYTGLKTFMKEQIEESTKWESPPEPPEKQTAQEWWERQCRLAAKDVGYYKSEGALDAARVAARRQWVLGLVELLGEPPQGILK